MDLIHVSAAVSSNFWRIYCFLLLLSVQGYAILAAVCFFFIVVLLYAVEILLVLCFFDDHFFFISVTVCSISVLFCSGMED